MWSALFFYANADLRELHVLIHSFPTRRSTDLPRLAVRNAFAAHLDLGRTADGARRHARDHGARNQFDIGQVAAIPILVLRASDAARQDRKSTRLNSSH